MSSGIGSNLKGAEHAKTAEQHSQSAAKQSDQASAKKPPARKPPLSAPMMRGIVGEAGTTQSRLTLNGH
jgi:hypothetical protein